MLLKILMEMVYLMHKIVQVRKVLLVLLVQ